jgi:hypothetical protein
MKLACVIALLSITSLAAGQTLVRDGKSDYVIVLAQKPLPANKRAAAELNAHLKRMAGVDLATGKVVNYSNAPDQYDEPEGVFPDGLATLVECDKQNRKGSGYIDLWKLALDGSGKLERLTFFSDVLGYKASNGVVSDDGRFIAFQLAKSREAAGVGHGIFIYDIEKASK